MTYRPLIPTRNSTGLSPQPDEETISEVEKRLGYGLPAAYIELCHHRNGGFNRACFPTMEETSWAEAQVAITAYSAIGWDTANSLCGSCGPQFMIEEWGYPPIGIVFGQCPSAGHDVIMLDYCECGPEGRPRIVHIDQEFDYAQKLLAPNFASFIKGLVPTEDVEDAEEQERERLHAVELALVGSLSPQVLRLLEDSAKVFPEGELFLRKQLARIAQDKGSFLLQSSMPSSRRSLAT